MDTSLTSSWSLGVVDNHTSSVMPSKALSTPPPGWRVSLLIISLTINGCTGVFLLTRTALNRWANIHLKKRKSSLLTLHLKSDWFLSKILTEQLTTWSSIVLAVLDIASGEVIDYPFIPRLSRDLTLCRVVFCINMGKHMFKSLLSTMYCQHQPQFRVDLLHHAVTVCCFGVFHFYSENLFLGLVGILMECDTIWLDIVHILREVGCVTDSKGYRRLVILSATVTVTSRGLLPLTTIGIALSKQNLMSMHFVMILFWFTALIFFGALNIWMIAGVTLRLRGLCLGNPLSVHLDNDVEEAPPSGHCPQGESPISSSSQGSNITLTDKTIPLQYKNDLSYLSPFSNVNITYDTTENKYNLSKKRITTKETVNNATILLTHSHPMINSGDGNQRHRTATQNQTIPQLCETNMDFSPATDPRRSVPSTVNDRATTTTSRPGPVVDLETRLDATSSGVHHIVVSAQHLPERAHRILSANIDNSNLK